MKTIQINLYSFNELSEEAKKKALENWSIETEYFGADEVIDTLKKFAEHFNSEAKDWSIDWSEPYRNSVRFDVPDYVEEWTEKELKAQIMSMGDYNKKTLRGNGDCVFTGVCFDEDVADGAREAYFKGERNVKEILLAGFNSLMKAANDDYESQMSMEYFENHCNANDYTFEEDGTMNNG